MSNKTCWNCGHATLIDANASKYRCIPNDRFVVLNIGDVCSAWKPRKERETREMKKDKATPSKVRREYWTYAVPIPVIVETKDGKERKLCGHDCDFLFIVEDTEIGGKCELHNDAVLEAKFNELNMQIDFECCRGCQETVQERGDNGEKQE